MTAHRRVWNSRCINRIRLEFKESRPLQKQKCLLVLIESDWNLKQAEYHDMTPRQMRINRIRLEFKDRQSGEGICRVVCVLIESDWNLKLFPIARPQSFRVVLIESDWNLKYNGIREYDVDICGINRIRLEFKDDYTDKRETAVKGINRIRLEFKVLLADDPDNIGISINRIRLEFKVICTKRSCSHFTY